MSWRLFAWLARPARPMIACRPTPGRRENARSIEKSAWPGRETRVGAGCTGKRSHYRSWRCKPRMRPDRQPLRPVASAGLSSEGNRSRVVRGHPVLRFQHYFQPLTQPHGPVDLEATVASNGLTGALYAGGQKVDYVAVAVAELAPLILTLGRRCEKAARTARSARQGAAAARHTPQTGGPRQLYRSSAPTGEQMDIE